MEEDEKVCPRCAETIKRAALVCRFCRHEFPEAEPPPVPEASNPDTASRTGLLIGGGLIGFMVLLLIVGQLSGNSASNTTMNVDDNLTMDMNAIDPALNLNAVAATPETATGWSYDSSTDELRGSAVHRASIESSNSVNFDFPYNGGSTLRMTVRKHPEYGEDVFFVISKGQFTCGIDDCSGTINFGSGPEDVELVEPADNSSDTLFAANGDYVISKLRKSKKVIVELPFYQEGNRQFTFEAGDALKWPPGGSAKTDETAVEANAADE